MAAAFIAVAVVLCVLVILFLALGLRSRKGGDAAEKARIRTNIEELRANYAELVAGHDAGRVSDEEFEETRSELERRVLDESRAGETLEASDRKQRLGTIAFVAVFVPIAAALFYWRFGAWAAFNPQVAGTQQQDPAGHSMAELGSQLTKLEQSLKENPGNVNGWMLLARTNDALKRFDKAAAAYEKLAALVQGEMKAEVLADWADCLAASTQTLEGKPESLVDQALKINPKYWKALALKGTAMYNRSDFKGAAAVWERILADQQPGTEDYANVLNMVNDARSKAGMKQLSGSVARMVESGAAATGAPAAQGAVQVSGTVELSPDLRQGLTRDETVFIYARPAEGSKMPVAVTQKRVSDLPAKFTLDSTMRLPGGMGGMEAMTRVVVGARVSKSGNLMPQAGDLEGDTPAVAVGSANLVVKITKKLEP